AGGTAAGLPIAAVAAGLAIVRAIVRGREVEDASPLATAVPIAGLLVAAVWAAVNEAPHAGVLAVLLGVAAATTLAVELMCAHARREVEEARERIARGLDVKVR